MADAFDKEEISKVIVKLKRRGQKQKRCLSLSPKTCSKEDFAKRLVSFCKKNGGYILGENKYNLLRKGQSKYPSSGTYRKVFGSWKEACEFCFGQSNDAFSSKKAKENSVLVDSFCSGMDESSLVRLLIEYKVTSYRKYVKARNTYPDVFPSPTWVLDRFGKFSVLFDVAKKISVDCEMEKLVNYRLNNKGRIPSEKVLSQAGINMKMLKRVLGGFRKVTKLSAGLVYAIEIKKRNQR